MLKRLLIVPSILILLAAGSLQASEKLYPNPGSPDWKPSMSTVYINLVNSGNVGTVETSLWKEYIGGGILQKAGKTFIVDAYGAFGPTTNNKTVTFRMTGSTVYTWSTNPITGTAITRYWHLHAILYKLTSTSVTTNSMGAWVEMGTNLGSLAYYANAGTINYDPNGAPLIIEITGTGTVTDDVQLYAVFGTEAL